MSIVMQGDEELTIREVCKILNLDRNTVYKRIRGESGKKLKARREGNSYRVKRSDLDEYRKSTYETGE